ncbi:MAG: glutaredoxin/malate transporter fusion protein [Ilumatobacteraceae bacterium]|nr:glutaredoxin/malate transporter fusion protein [Ilumatobacteraceae bacterium]
MVGIRRYDDGMRSLFRFPNPVNEVSARLVAGGVVFQCVAFIAFRQWWQLIPLAYGFVARVLTGPTLSPLGQFVTCVVTPRLHVPEKLVAGSPKRFAQGMGATMSLGAAASWAADVHWLAIVLVAGITVAATLESVFAICLGCIAFARLMRWGVIPDTVCESCNDITARLTEASRSAASVRVPATR